MLSNPLHRSSTYSSLSSSNMLANGLTATSMHSSGLDGLTHKSQYSLQQLQQHSDHRQIPRVPKNHSLKHRQHPYSASSAGMVDGSPTVGKSTAGPIRRRISRACDQCNQLRTKCNGQTPCAHCVEFGLGCEYIRERKKRGKASRKDLAQQAAAAAANGHKSPGANSSEDQSPIEPGLEDAPSTLPRSNDGEFSPAQRSRRTLSFDIADITDKVPSRQKPNDRLRTQSFGSDIGLSSRHQPHRPSLPEIDQIGSPSSLNGGYSNMHGYRPAFNTHLMNHETSFSDLQGNMPVYNDLPYAAHSQTPESYPGNTPGGFRLADTPLPGFSMETDNTSPGWMTLASPSHQYQQHMSQSNPSSLRYPVLEPLVSHLDTIISLPSACQLLDLYFASSSSALMHPTSPYVLGYVFRRNSILHPTKPRQCSPALLASILWIAAQTSDASFLTALPSSRGRICQKLLELTIGLLKPLVHSPFSNVNSSSSVNTVDSGVALNGLAISLPTSASADGLSEGLGLFGTAGTLDDVVTYIHLATVVSASEYKGASLRWWNSAWSLARELKLGQEIPQTLDPEFDGEINDRLSNLPLTEEEREERRRVWWLCYTMDRHLALCYNKPLFLLDMECAGLLQPMDDTLWQAGEYYTGDSSLHITSPSNAQRIRRAGPNFECTGHSIFGYFLPLMTILGEIVDLSHAKNHPRFGIGLRSATEWDNQTSEIARQLDIYGQSLRDFETRALGGAPSGHNPERSPETTLENDDPDINRPSPNSVQTTTSNHQTEVNIQTRIVVAYGTHVMHVLHILLTGKWDPISLLDDNDLWISSQSFIDATSHAVSAAEAINSILEYDPGLEFMPFFFGVYLLQGSFLLLLIADKLQVEASARVVGACETIVRAHEACVVTLNTEYQRNFRKVMRSALVQVKGRIPEDFGEQQLKRREVLSLYRWTGNGTGLAL